MDFEEDVLGDFFCVFFVAQIPKRELINARTVRVGEIRKCLFVAPLQPGEQGVDRVVGVAMGFLVVAGENPSGGPNIPVRKRRR